MHNAFAQLQGLKLQMELEEKQKKALEVKNNLELESHLHKKIQVWRGEIYYADIDGNIGSEQGGTRPVLVVQNDIGNTYSPTTIVVMLTSELCKAKLPTHIELYSNEHGLDSDSVILFEQIRTIDKKRLKERICKLDEEVIERVDKALDVAIKAHKSKQPIDKLPESMRQIINNKLDGIYNLEGLLKAGNFITPNYKEFTEMEHALCMEALKQYCKQNRLLYTDYYTKILTVEKTVA